MNSGGLISILLSGNFRSGSKILPHKHFLYPHRTYRLFLVAALEQKFLAMFTSSTYCAIRQYTFVYLLQNAPGLKSYCCHRPCPCVCVCESVLQEKGNAETARMVASQLILLIYWLLLFQHVSHTEYTYQCYRVEHMANHHERNTNQKHTLHCMLAAILARKCKEQTLCRKNFHSCQCQLPNTLHYLARCTNVVSHSEFTRKVEKF